MFPPRDPQPAITSADAVPVRRCIATISLSGTLEEKLTAAARAGFDGVEIFEGDLITSHLSPAEIRAKAADLGLAIMLYQPFRDFEAVPDDVLKDNLRRAARKFDLMASLGTATMLVCSSVSPTATADNSRAADQLRRLADLAERSDMRVAYEALAWGRHVRTYQHAWQLVAAADHPRLGLCLDSFHIISRGDAPAAIREISGDKIFFLQLADAPLLSMDTLPWSRHYRCFPGQGGFDLAGFMTDVLATGYAGPWSLEVFNDVFRQADAGRTAVDGMRSLLTLEDTLRQSLRDGPEHAGRVPVGLASLPVPAGLPGFAFVELCVDALIEPAVEQLLRGLGFARAGRHQSKPVQLWEQADARVLVNRLPVTDETRPRGAAGVAAIALESAAPGQSAERARALLAPVIPRSRQPGEADLSAVAAPDGTQIFFCRTDVNGSLGWRGDFRAAATPSPGPAVQQLLTGVDHIALSQPFDYFDEATLFYQALLGLAPQDSQEIASPYGLVRSRAMRSTNGSVRLVLHVPQLGGGRLPGTASFQHVAFSSPDVLAAARALHTAGIPTLPIPGNYYDDLAARHDLDPGLADELRDLGVLYDRDARGGEFLHIYTVMLGQRMFFEIVQRNDGYDGYGAPNTPVRMAAQLHQMAMGGIGPG
jgi:4-hydroxyphenylpyruvate dioxygenase